MRKKRVWIHCRVLTNASKTLLDYQEDILTTLAQENNQQIVGVTKEISNGKNFTSFGMKTLITEIKRNKIDVVLVTSKKRIAVFDDLYEEFELVCRLHNVMVISNKEMENSKYTSILL